ncbi:protein D3-like [Planococcus citri]|uniref:protein D3-like n=1 Tax=Planococcus citri TaxID=170843 RepID=UPI0031F84D6F
MLENFFSLACLLIIAIYWSPEPCQAKSVGQMFKLAKLIPNMIESVPNSTCRVSFTYYCAAPRPGQEIRVDMASLRAPKVRWEARKNRWYTMIMASPDMPDVDNSTYYQEWDEWVVVNIPQRKLRKGNVIRPYKIGQEARNNGPTYYVFLIYEQPEYLYFVEEVQVIPGVRDWRSSWFVYKYNLTGPVAANYYKMVYQRWTTVLYTPRPKKLQYIGNKSRFGGNFRKTTQDPYYYESVESGETTTEPTTLFTFEPWIKIET